jgi:hypothetical protein
MAKQATATVLPSVTGPPPVAAAVRRPPTPPAKRAGSLEPEYADPRILTPAERLVAYGRLLARALERVRARRQHAHATRRSSKQKRN